MRLKHISLIFFLLTGAQCKIEEPQNPTLRSDRQFEDERLVVERGTEDYQRGPEEGTGKQVCQTSNLHNCIGLDTTDMRHGNFTEDSSPSSEEEKEGFFEEEDPGDSDVSEERWVKLTGTDDTTQSFRNPEDFINNELTPVKIESEQRRPDDSVSIISNAFNNRQVKRP